MLYEKLLEHAASGIYPMHMPGHKRNMQFSCGLPYEIDITEIHGFDNLHEPRGIIKAAAELAARLYGSERAFLLIGGSTSGIHAAVGSCVRRGDKILMARNCHISVYNAASLFGLDTTYIAPDIDTSFGIACSIRPEDVESALQRNPDTKLVVITSPTYEGVISDVRSIAGIVHKMGIPLLVDEAHGAHLGFSESFSGGSVRAGADISVMSLHKTLPALTQTALLHVSGSLVNSNKIERLLSVLQTSSPSYLLMASISHCLNLLSSDSSRLFREYEQRLRRFDGEISALQKLCVLCCGTDSPHPGFFAFDPGKLVISTRNTALTGVALAEILRTEYKIELELAAADYAIAMTSICDSDEGFAALADALLCIDSKYELLYTPAKPLGSPPIPVQICTIDSALECGGEHVPREKAGGLISLEYIWAYPPGIPIIAPGELISSEITAYIDRAIGAGVRLSSTSGGLPEFILTVPNPADCLLTPCPE